MKNTVSPLRIAVGTLNSIFSYVVVAFMIDITYAFWVRHGFGVFAFSIIVPIKIYLYSGMCGMLVDMAADRKTLHTLTSFKNNARTFWVWYLCALLIPACVSGFAHTSVISIGPITLFVILQYLDIVVLCVVAGLMIRKKYCVPLKHARVRITISGAIALTFCVLCLLAMLVASIPLVVYINNVYVLRIIAFASTYLRFLLFLYVALIIIRQYPRITQKTKTQRELFLINLAGGGVIDHVTSLLLRSYPPVFMILRALTPREYHIREFNRVIWREHFYQADVLVAITCCTANSAEAYTIAKGFKKRGARVIMGGPHVTHLPEEALCYCDSVVIGEVESVWCQIVDDYEKGTLKLRYEGPALPEYYRAFHRELLDAPPAVARACLETTRGCKYHCDFCTIPSLSNRVVRKRPVADIVALITKIKKHYKNFVFIDNNIYSDPAYARELFQALIPLHIHWVSSSSIDIAKDDAALALAKKSGCTSLLFGYEIFGGSLEKKKGGKLALARHYVALSKKIKKAGMRIKAHFIFGFDTDSLGDALRLWRFCFSLPASFTAVSLLTPLPGSTFYDRMLAEKRLINLNWRKYTLRDVVFRPARMPRALLAVLFPLMSAAISLTTSRALYVLIPFLLFSILRSHITALFY